MSVTHSAVCLFISTWLLNPFGGGVRWAWNLKPFLSQKGRKSAGNQHSPYTGRLKKISRRSDSDSMSRRKRSKAKTKAFKRTFNLSRLTFCPWSSRRNEARVSLSWKTAVTQTENRCEQKFQIVEKCCGRWYDALFHFWASKPLITRLANVVRIKWAIQFNVKIYGKKLQSIVI